MFWTKKKTTQQIADLQTELIAARHQAIALHNALMAALYYAEGTISHMDAIAMAGEHGYVIGRLSTVLTRE